MNAWPPGEEERVRERLFALGALQPCGRCANSHFLLAQGYVNLPLVTDPFQALGGQSLPAVAVICNRCGAVYLHALGVLGPLPTHAPPPPDAAGEPPQQP